MKVIVCGGRDYADKELLFATLDHMNLSEPISKIICGDARGADAMAADWARQRMKYLSVFNADWATHGKAAGPIRNEAMLKYGHPDYVVAFPGGRGTANMIRQAREAGVTVYRVGHDGSIS